MAENTIKTEPQDEKALPAARKKSGKGWKIALWIIMSPIILFIVLAIVLSLPPVQKFAVNVVCNKLTESSGMSIHVDYIRLKFPLTLTVEGLTAIQGPDTLIMAETADMDVSLKPLFDKKIELNKLKLGNAKINTDGMIAEFNLKGDIGELEMEAHDIDLQQEIANMDKISFSNSNLTITIPDSVPPDTTEALRWKAKLEKVAFNNTDIQVKLAPAADSMIVRTHFDNASLKGSIDLYTSDFLFHDLDLRGSTVRYDAGTGTRSDGFDPSHISLTDLNARLDSVTSRSSEGIVVAFNELSAKEASGIRIDTLSGQFRMDSTSLHTRNLRMLTSDSDLRIDADMDLDAFDPASNGTFTAKVRGSVGKDDVTALAPTLPSDIKKAYPTTPMRVDADINGNADALTINNLQASIDGKFSIHTRGTIENYMDTTSGAMNINLPYLETKVHDPKFVKGFLPAEMQSTVNIPANTSLTTSLGMTGNKISAKGELKDKSGTTRYDVTYDSSDDSYDADITANNLHVNNYVALDEPCNLTGHIRAKGRGTDIFSPKLTADISAQLEKANYGSFDLSNSDLKASADHGELNAHLSCDNPQLRTTLQLTSDIRKDNINARGRINLRRSDLRAMGLSEERLNIMAISDFNFNSDMKKCHSFEGMADSLFIVMGNDTISSGQIYLDGWTDRDTTNALVSTNGVNMHFSSSVNALELGDKYMKVAGIMGKQFEQRDIDLNYAKQFLPISTIDLSLNNDNAIAQMLKLQGVRYDDISGHFTTSPKTGLRGHGHIGNLKVKKDSVVIDNIDLNIMQDSTRLTYDVSLVTGEQAHHPGFSGSLKGYLENFSADARLTLIDTKGKTGLDLGIHALATDTAGYFRFYPEEPVLGFRKFTLNPDNYVLLKKKNKAYIDLHLASDNGTRIDVTANPDEAAQQDISLNIEQFGIAQLLSILPMAPDMDGKLNINAKYHKEDGETRIDGDVLANNFVFGGTRLGDVGATVSYVPEAENSHSINGVISQDTTKVARYYGTYNDNGHFSFNADLNQLPLEMSAPFLPDKQIVSASGYMGGHLSAEGNSDRFLVNGIGLGAAQVPADLKIADLNIVIVAAVLGIRGPFPAVAGKEPGPVMAGFILFQDQIIDLLWTVENTNVIIDLRHVRIGRIPDLQGMVQPGQIAVGSVAAELGYQLHTGDPGPFPPGPLFDFGHRPDVLQGNPLGFVDEKDRASAGMDDLLDLVLAQVVEHAGFLVQSVGLVHQDRIRNVFVCVHIDAGALEHVVDGASAHLSLQLLAVDVSGSRILADILDELVLVRQLGQKVDGHHRLACAGASFHDDGPLPAVFHALSGGREDLLIDHLLVVQHDEFPAALQHLCDGILQ